MIDFQALEQALAPLAEIGQEELTFMAGSTEVTLKVLVPSEELTVQRYAAEVVPKEDEGSDPHSAQAYLDRFRIEILAHSIIAVGSMDLRGVTAIPTGEILDNKKPVTIPTHKALRKLVARWTRPVIDSVFRKYGEALIRVEKKASEAIEFNPADLDTEIARVEGRLEVLKAEQEKRKNPVTSGFSNIMDLATDASHEAKLSREEGISALAALATTEAPVPEPIPDPVLPPAPEPVPPPPQPPMEEPARESRRPAVPQHGAPPPRIDQPHPAPPAEKPDHVRSPDGVVRSSFVESDNMQSEAEEETRRILDRRRRAAAGKAPLPSGSVLDSMRTQRAPHLDAAEVERQEHTVQHGADMAKAEELGAIGGVPTFRMPTQDLGTSQASPGETSTARPDGGSMNPRFRPPQK